MPLFAPFDEILDNYIGPLGRWQWELFWLVSFPCLIPTIFFPAFGMFIAPHRCRILDLDTLSNWTYDQVTLASIPFKDDPERPPMIGQSYNPCLQYNTTINNSLLNNESNYFVNTSNNWETCTNGWVFDHRKGVFQGSLVVEFNLVCDRQFLGPLSTTCYLIGSVLSCWIVGHISDKFGRRPVMITSSLLTFFMCGMVSLSPNIYVFCALRFVVGFFEFSLHVTTFLFLMEITTSRYRNVFSGLIAIVVGLIAYSCVPLLAVLTQNWRWLHFSIGCFCIPALSYYWLVPESPRWLMSVGREIEAMKIIRAMIRKNKSKLTEAEIDSMLLELSKDEIIKSCLSLASNSIVATHKSKNIMLVLLKQALSLFKNPILRKRTLMSILTWFEIGMVYYGSSYYSNNLQGNMYLVFWLMGIVAIPGAFLSFILYHKFGRNRPFFILQFLTVPFLAAAALYQIFRVDPTFDLPIVILVSLAKVMVDASYSMVYIYTPELFPTDIRNSGLALCCSVGRIGAGLAPFVIQLGTMAWRPLPLTLFASAIFIGAVCIMFQPETKNIPLPDNIAELESRWRHNRDGAVLSKLKEDEADLNKSADIELQIGIGDNNDDNSLLKKHNDKITMET